MCDFEHVRIAVEVFNIYPDLARAIDAYQDCFAGMGAIKEDLNTVKRLSAGLAIGTQGDWNLVRRQAEKIAKEKSQCCPACEELHSHQAGAQTVCARDFGWGELLPVSVFVSRRFNEIDPPQLQLIELERRQRGDGLPFTQH